MTVTRKNQCEEVADHAADKSRTLRPGAGRGEERRCGWPIRGTILHTVFSEAFYILRPLDTWCTLGPHNVRGLRPEYTLGHSARIHIESEPFGRESGICRKSCYQLGLKETLPQADFWSGCLMISESLRAYPCTFALLLWPSSMCPIPSCVCCSATAEHTVYVWTRADRWPTTA